MSELSKLLVKLSKENIKVTLIPRSCFVNKFDCITMELSYKDDLWVRGIVDYNFLGLLNFDGIYYKINELYEELKEKINNKDDNL